MFHFASILLFLLEMPNFACALFIIRKRRRRMDHGPKRSIYLLFSVFSDLLVTFITDQAFLFRRKKWLEGIFQSIQLFFFFSSSSSKRLRETEKRQKVSFVIVSKLFNLILLFLSFFLERIQIGYSKDSHVSQFNNTIVKCSTCKTITFHTFGFLFFVNMTPVQNIYMLIVKKKIKLLGISSF